MVSKNVLSHKNIAGYHMIQLEVLSVKKMFTVNYFTYMIWQYLLKMVLSNIQEHFTLA